MEKTTDRSISQAVIECDDKFRERILFRLASLGDGADVTQDSELAVAATHLCLAGCLVFDKNNFTNTNYEQAVTEPVLQTAEAADTAVISASVTANSTRFEDEHVDMDAEMAGIDTSNMNALSS